MKVEKTICDRCGKDITISANNYSVLVKGASIYIPGKEIDLCAECKKELDKFLGE